MPWSTLSVPAALVLSLAALLSGCERTEPARVEAPPDTADALVSFRLIGPNDAALVVPVRINGRGPYDFVLDTGATLTCVDDGLARELELPETRALAYGAGVGGRGAMRLVRADSVQVGGTSAHDLTICSIDLVELRRLPGMHVDGLLGLNFLKSFRVTLDFSAATLRLDPADG